MKTEDPARRDSAPGGAKRPEPPIGWLRRIICGVLGVALLGGGAWIVAAFLDHGGRWVIVFAGATMAFGGLVLLGTAASGR